MSCWPQRRSLVGAKFPGEATNGFVEVPTAQPLRGAPPAGSVAAEGVRAAAEADEEAAPADATVVQPGEGHEGGF